MIIKVYNNNSLVHHGTLEQFLHANENDEWLSSECERLVAEPSINLMTFSGEWIIEKA